MQTNQIAQQWVKFARNVDVKTTLKMFVVGFPIIEGDPNCKVKSKLMNLNKTPMCPANSAKSVSDNSSKTVPKQVVDIIDVINHGQSSGKNLRRTLELDTLSTTSRKSNAISPGHVYTDFL